MQVNRFAILMVLSTSVWAQSWVPLSETTQKSWEALAGSLALNSTDRSNEPVVVITLRVRDKASGLIEFERNYVRLADCKAGSGKLVTTDMAGTPRYDNDFVFGGGNVASTIAQMICRAAEATRI